MPASTAWRRTATFSPGTASLKFGTNAATALAAKWKLLAALVAAAFLVGLIPVPRHKKRWQDDPETPGAAGDAYRLVDPARPVRGLGPPGGIASSTRSSRRRPAALASARRSARRSAIPGGPEPGRP